MFGLPQDRLLGLNSLIYKIYYRAICQEREVSATALTVVYLAVITPLTGEGAVCEHNCSKRVLRRILQATVAIGMNVLVVILILATRVSFTADWYSVNTAASLLLANYLASSSDLSSINSILLFDAEEMCTHSKINCSL